MKGYFFISTCIYLYLCHFFVLHTHSAIVIFIKEKRAV